MVKLNPQTNDAKELWQPKEAVMEKPAIFRAWAKWWGSNFKTRMLRNEMLPTNELKNPKKIIIKILN